MWSNIKTVVEENVSSGNVYVASYLTFCTMVDEKDEVAMYHQQTN